MVRILVLLLSFGFQFAFADIVAVTETAAAHSKCAEHTRQSALVEQLPQQYDAVRWDGLFQVASDERLDFILHKYANHKKNPPVFDLKKIRMAVESDIKTWACDHPRSTTSAHHMRLVGIKAHAEQVPTPISAPLVRKLRAHGYEGFSPLYFFTSGAGNWTRGGKLVKANIPLNLRELLSDKEWEELIFLSNYVVGTHEVRRTMIIQAQERHPQLMPILHVQNIQDVEKRMREIIRTARNNPKSVNVIEAKFAQVAALSAQTRRYIHFDIWTSGKTHQEIRESLLEFYQTYRQKIFVEDLEQNERIHDAIERYLAASRDLNETHLFGYQEEVFPLSPSSEAKPTLLLDEDRNGEGAGKAFVVLGRTGRSAQLQLRGVKHWMFQNIEVLSMDLLAEYGAYLESKRPVGVVLVPEQEGFAGGYPYIETNDLGEEWPKLLEGFGIPPELKKAPPGMQAYFNSNTMFFRFDINEMDGMDFEPNKPGRHGSPVTLPKLTLVLHTHNNRTELIGGLAWKNYQNFKGLADYERGGPMTLDLHREFLAATLTP